VCSIPKYTGRDRGHGREGGGTKNADRTDGAKGARNLHTGLKQEGRQEREGFLQKL